MKNVKDEVVGALDKVFGEDHVKDSYPKSWETLPVVIVVEEQNKIYEYSSGDEKIIETKSQIRYRIDIFDKASTSGSAKLVDDAIGVGGLGLYRSDCTDVDDPSGFKHKLMRYEGIIDMENDFVEWFR